MPEFIIPQPSKDIFQFQSADEQIKSENQTVYEIDYIEYEGGIKIYYKDADFPRKGFPTSEAIFACNIVKRLLIESSKLPLYLLVFRRKALVQAIISFNTIALKVISPYIIRYEYRTPLAQELYCIIKWILQDLGIPKQACYEFAMIVSMLIEYDDAYRFRIQDIMDETSKSFLLTGLRTEIKRLLKILKDRDNPGVYTKFERITKIILVMLLWPKFNKIVRNAIVLCKLDKLQYDLADKYWVCMRNDDYKFLGLTYEQRQHLAGKKPQGYKIK